MQMRWVQLMAIAIGKIIFLSYLLEKTGNIMHALNRLPGSAFFASGVQRSAFSLCCCFHARVSHPRHWRRPSSSRSPTTATLPMPMQRHQPPVSARWGHLCWRMYAASGHSGSQLHAANAGSECRCFHRLCADTDHVGTNHTERDIQGCGGKPPSVCRQSDGLRALCQYILQRSPVRRRDGATNACGQSQMISGGDTGTTTGAGGAWYWLKGTVPAGTGSLTIDFGESYKSRTGRTPLGNFLSWWEEHHAHQFAQHDLWRSGIRRWLPGEQYHH